MIAELKRRAAHPSCKPLAYCPGITKPLKKGQTPFAAVLSCADSRVLPEKIFKLKKRGELFVVRVDGNVANTDAIASMQFAVKALGVRVIVVMGHESCGAVSNAVEYCGTTPPEHGWPTASLFHLFDQICRAVGPRRPKDTNKDFVKRNANTTAYQMQSDPEYLGHSGVVVVPAYYSYSTDSVEWLDAVQVAT
ncbi:MAG: carbonic anhydrase [Bacteroidota bacterium]